MTGRYTFTLFDINNTLATAAPLLNVVSAKESSEWQGAHTLKLRVPVFDAMRIPVTTYDGEHASVFGISDLQEKKFINKGDSYGNNTGSFVIQSVTTARDGTDLFYDIVAEEFRNVELLDTRIDIQGDFAGMDAQTLLTLISSATSFSLAVTDIPTTEYRSFTFAYPTALELLNLIVSEFSGSVTYYWLVSGSTLAVYSSTHAIWTTHDSPISYHSNLLGVSRDSDAHALANTIYGAGNDGLLNLMMAGSTRYLNDALSTTITAAAGTVTVNLDGAGATTNPVMVNSDIFIELKHSAVKSSTGTVSWDYKLELLDSTDTVVATLEDTFSYSLAVTITDTRVRQVMSIDRNFPDVKKINLTVTADNSSPFASSWTWAIAKLGHVNAANTATVSDAASITKYGTVEGAVRINKPAIYNLFNDSESVGISPTMSGTYTSGLHDGWTKIGTPTTTKNTTTTYIESGSASQKVVAATVGDGITIDADPFVKGLPLLKNNRSYSLRFRIYVESGSVNVKAVTGEGVGTLLFEEATTGFKWLSVTAEGFDTGSAEDRWRQVTFELTAKKANTTFYLDSVCLHEGPKYLGFTELHTADELKTKADLALAQNLSPLYRYRVDFTDLFSRGDLDKVIYDSAEYTAGNKVKIDDEELGISKTLRIKQIEYDLLNPTRGKMDLEEDGTQFDAPLAKTIGNIRVNQVANSGARGL